MFNSRRISTAEQIKQLTEETLRLEAQIKTLREGEAALRGELERRPPLDFDPAKTKVGRDTWEVSIT